MLDVKTNFMSKPQNYVNVFLYLRNSLFMSACGFLIMIIKSKLRSTVLRQFLKVTVINFYNSNTIKTDFFILWFESRKRLNETRAHLIESVNVDNR